MDELEKEMKQQEKGFLGWATKRKKKGWGVDWSCDKHVVFSNESTLEMEWNDLGRPRDRKRNRKQGKKGEIKKR